MRNTGYTPTNGATTNMSAITSVATRNVRLPRAVRVSMMPARVSCEAAAVVSMLLALLSEQARRLQHQHDHHDHEDHGIRRLRVEDLRQAFDHAEPEAGDDRAHDRSHAADDHHREHDDDQVCAHLRI